MPIAKSHLVLSAVAFFASLASVAFAAEPAQFPLAHELPAIKELPDPFLFFDGGSRVQTKQDWQRRRSELVALVEHYEYGKMPPPPGNVKAKELGSGANDTAGANE